MKREKYNQVYRRMLFLSGALMAGFCFVLWRSVPPVSVRYTLLALCTGIILLFLLWGWFLRRQVASFADELCGVLDALIAGREPENPHPYEDSLTAKVQSKLIQCYDIMNAERLQSQQDKQTLQEIVSDISHQVKTPIANLQMLTGILQQHQLSDEKRAEFLSTMAGQVNKLDFLMQSLIKMSRLETGILTMHIKRNNLSNTIAQAVSTIWAKAEKKQIQLAVECSSDLAVQHDPKWTAEALGNILDNAVKYTPEGGSVAVFVRPWQFYTRIDITDTGIGIPEPHYHDVFRRFYRAQEAAAEEGVGLGLYLAQGIIARQKGYISVKSQRGKGTTFSVYLLS